MNSIGPKAQGKSINRAALTGSLLRVLVGRRSSSLRPFLLRPSPSSVGPNRIATKQKTGDRSPAFLLFVLPIVQL